MANLSANYCSAVPNVGADNLVILYNYAIECCATELSVKLTSVDLSGHYLY